jgi:hypothetical protein
MKQTGFATRLKARGIMNKYRIIKKDGAYRIQSKFLLVWLDCLTLGESPIEFSTQSEAETTIEKWLEEEKEDGKIVKEY